jgi:hypothetical protein
VRVVVAMVLPVPVTSWLFPIARTVCRVVGELRAAVVVLGLYKSAYDCPKNIMIYHL